MKHSVFIVATPFGRYLSLAQNAQRALLQKTNLVATPFGRPFYHGECTKRPKGVATKWLFVLWLAIFFGFPTQAEDPLPVAAINRTKPIDFSSEILPVLKKNCLACHNETKAKADLILESPASILKGGETGPAVVPGKAKDSLLFVTAAHLEDPPMPPPKNKSKAQNLNPEQLGLLQSWINQGAQGKIQSYAPAPDQWIADRDNHSILAIAISPDDRFLACARGHFIDLYDLVQNRLVTRLQDPKLEFGAHLDVVHSVAFSKDGTLASGGFREIKLWRRPPEKPSDWSGQLPAPQHSGLTIDANKAIVQIGEDPPRTLTHPATIAHVAVSPDQQYMVTAAEKGSAVLWSVKDGKSLANLDLTPGFPGKIAAAQAGETIQNRLVTTFTNLVKTRDAAVTKEKELGLALTKSITELEAEQKKAQGDDADKARRKLESAKRNARAAVKTTAEAEKKLAEAKAKVAAATKARDGFKAKVAELNNQRSDAKQNRQIVGVGIWTGHNEVVIGFQSGLVIRLHNPSGAYLGAIKTGSQLDLVQVHDDVVITKSTSGALQKWPLDRPCQLSRMIGDGKDGDILIDRVSALAFSPDGKMLVSGSGIPTRSGSLKIWDSVSGKPIAAAPRAHHDTITSIRFNPAGDAFVSGGADKFARVYAVPSLKLLESLEGHTGHVLSVDWSRDGQTIVTAGSDFNIKLWDVAIGEVTRNHKRGDFQATGVRFASLSNDTLVGSFGDKTIKFEATSFGESPGITYAIELSHDGKKTVAGGDDGKVRIWETPTRKLLHVFEPPKQ